MIAVQVNQTLPDFYIPPISRILLGAIGFLIAVSLMLMCGSVYGCDDGRFYIHASLFSISGEGYFSDVKLPGTVTVAMLLNFGNIFAGFALLGMTSRWITAKNPNTFRMVSGMAWGMAITSIVLFALLSAARHTTAEWALSRSASWVVSYYFKWAMIVYYYFCLGAGICLIIHTIATWNAIQNLQRRRDQLNAPMMYGQQPQAGVPVQQQPYQQVYQGQQPYQGTVVPPTPMPAKGENVYA